MTEKNLSPKQQEKRNHILNAAIHLFAQNGFTTTTVSDIAKDAGVSFGTVFTYFENKEALFKSTILEPLDRFEPAFSSKAITDEPILEQLEVIIKEQIMFMAEHRDYLQLIQQVLGQPAKFPELLERLDQQFAKMMEAITPLIEKGQAEKVLYQESSWMIAASYISFLIGIRLTFTVQGLAEVIDALVPQALKLFSPLKIEG